MKILTYITCLLLTTGTIAREHGVPTKPYEGVKAIENAKKYLKKGSFYVIQDGDSFVFGMIDPILATDLKEFMYMLNECMQFHAAYNAEPPRRDTYFYRSLHLSRDVSERFIDLNEKNPTFRAHEDWVANTTYIYVDTYRAYVYPRLQRTNVCEVWVYPSQDTWKWIKHSPLPKHKRFNPHMF